MKKKYSVILVAVVIGVFAAIAFKVYGGTALDEVPLEKKVGRMIMVGFRGLEVTPESPIIKDIEAGRIGGVVLYDRDVALGSPERNIKSPEQVKKLISTLQAHADHKLLIAIDQEGGRVCRLKEEFGFSPTVSHQYLGELDDPDMTFFYADRIARTLSDLGINVNFAPVVDLNVNPASPAIGNLERSFSSDSETVARHAEIFIRAHQRHGVMTALKHFPGHGSATTDSHKGFTDITNTWTPEELTPFRRLIETAHPPMIMTAHVFNANLDPEYPATLSRPILTGLLRNEMNFSGIIISDDMNMNAISENYGLETAIEKAINAGVDILLFGNNLTYDPEIATKAQAIILDLIKKGKVTLDTDPDRVTLRQLR